MKLTNPNMKLYLAVDNKLIEVTAVIAGGEIAVNHYLSMVGLDQGVITSVEGSDIHFIANYNNLGKPFKTGA